MSQLSAWHTLCGCCCYDGTPMSQSCPPEAAHGALSPATSVTTAAPSRLHSDRLSQHKAWLHVQGMPEGNAERVAWPWWKTKKWALHIAARLFNRYGEPQVLDKSSQEQAFAEMWSPQCSVQFLTAIMQLLARFAQVQPGILLWSDHTSSHACLSLPLLTRRPSQLSSEAQASGPAALCIVAPACCCMC